MVSDTVLNGSNSSIYLFDSNILNEIKYECHQAISASAGSDFVIRPLKKDDHKRGYLKLLAELTTVGEVSQEQFEEQFECMKACKDSYFVVVVEQLSTETVVGSSTLAVEHKFIRGCAKRGRLEDVVVASNQRGKQLGKILVETVKSLAGYVGCYKISLDCKDSMVPYYESIGYKKEPGNSNTLVIRLS